MACRVERTDDAGGTLPEAVPPPEVDEQPSDEAFEGEEEDDEGEGEEKAIEQAPDETLTDETLTDGEADEALPEAPRDDELPFDEPCRPPRSRHRNAEAAGGPSPATTGDQWMRRSVLEEILAAIGSQRQLFIDVSSEGREWSTQFSPYLLEAGDLQWRVIGRSTLHRRLLNLPLPQVIAARRTDIPYRIPRGFRCRSKHVAPQARTPDKASA